MNDQLINPYQELTRQALKASDRSIYLPFELKLTDCDDPFVGDEVIRIIPRKRIVVLGTWRNKKVVAKLFYGSRKAAAQATRDRQGIDALTDCGIPTPMLYHQDVSLDQGIHILILEKIENANNFEELWKAQPHSASVISLLHTLTIEIATQHVLGIVQKDLHFKNFLVSADQVYTLDGGSIEKFDHIIARKESLESLALFIAQLGVAAIEYRDALFHTYAKARGWLIKKGDYSFLQTAIEKNLKNRWGRYQKKIFRNCTAFKKIANSKSLIMYGRNDDSHVFQHFLTNPEVAFAQHEKEILKAGRTTTVIAVMIDGHDAVIKRYNIKDFWHALKRCLRPTRAAMSWRLSHYLCLMGIPTAKPIAFIEKRWLGLRNTSYFVMENIHGQHVGEYFSRSDLTDEKKTMMANKVFQLLIKLAHLRLTHGDLKMTNILICQNEPILIDLDGMQEHSHSYSFQRAFRKELKRFLRNWNDNPTVYHLFEDLFKRI